MALRLLGGKNIAALLRLNVLQSSPSASLWWQLSMQSNCNVVSWLYSLGINTTSININLAQQLFVTFPPCLVYLFLGDFLYFECSPLPDVSPLVSPNCLTSWCPEAERRGSGSDPRIFVGSENLLHLTKPDKVPFFSPKNSPGLNRKSQYFWVSMLVFSWVFLGVVAFLGNFGASGLTFQNGGMLWSYDSAKLEVWCVGCEEFAQLKSFVSIW